MILCFYLTLLMGEILHPESVKTLQIWDELCMTPCRNLFINRSTWFIRGCCDDSGWQSEVLSDDRWSLIILCVYWWFACVWFSSSPWECWIYCLLLPHCLHNSDCWLHPGRSASSLSRQIKPSLWIRTRTAVQNCFCRYYVYIVFCLLANIWCFSLYTYMSILYLVVMEFDHTKNLPPGVRRVTIVVRQLGWHIPSWFCDSRTPKSGRWKKYVKQLTWCPALRWMAKVNRKTEP